MEKEKKRKKNFLSMAQSKRKKKCIFTNKFYELKIYYIEFIYILFYLLFIIISNDTIFN